MNEPGITGLEPVAHASSLEGQKSRRESWWSRRRRPSQVPEEFEALDDPEAPSHQIDSLA
ncbi:MAG: hypothetical protein WB421_20620 [Terriglobales bacterium]